MNKTFSFQRFTKYFVYDLKSSWHNAGLTLLIISCMPVFVFAFYELFSLLFAHKLGYLNHGAVVAGYVTSFIIAVLSFPTRQYGSITDKKAGSAWIMLPASAFEKFLSLLLICCIVVPAVWLSLMAATDGLLSLVSKHYGDMVLPIIFGGLNTMMSELTVQGFHLGLGMVASTWLSWCGNILFFALAAIVFKKYKIVYGFLVIWGIGVLLSILMGFGLMAFNPSDIKVDINPERFLHFLNIFIYVIYFVEFALLDLGLYFRIKTIKH